MKCRNKLGSALTCLIVLVTGMEPGTVSAATTGGDGTIKYSETGWDQRDFPEGPSPDIQLTSRRVVKMSDHRVLVIRVRVYRKLGNYWRMQVGLDSRHGNKPDFRMTLVNADLNGAGCYVERKQPKHQLHPPRGRFVQHGKVARCRIRLSTIHPTRHVRWRVRSYSLNHPAHPDRAPTHGWFL